MVTLCSIQSCENEATETVKTVFADPNKATASKHDLKVCDEHLKLLNLNTPTRVSIRATTVDEVNEKTNKNIVKF